MGNMNAPVLPNITIMNEHNLQFFIACNLVHVCTNGNILESSIMSKLSMHY